MRYNFWMRGVYLGYEKHILRNGETVTVIKKINIKTGDGKTIESGFCLNLDQLTIITGENNSGKTNFMKLVAGESKTGETEFLDENGKPITPEIVYIASENIKPSDDVAKHSARNTSLIKNLSKLFSSLGFKLNLSSQDDLVETIQTVEKQANENLKEFSGDSGHMLRINVNEGELASDIVIQSLIQSIDGYENKDKRGLDDLGQGTQRMIIVSLLKAYLDILIKKKIEGVEHTLIVFEEPEAYLHPRLKRRLNATLRGIMEHSGLQVLATTHDPYFAFKNFMEKDTKVVFFEKKDGITEKPQDGIFGVEDELLFIFLYSYFLKKVDKEALNKIKIGKIKERRGYYKSSKKNKDGALYIPSSDLTYIRDQIHHLGDNSEYTLGLVFEIPVGLDKNYFTESDLREGIEEMSKVLVKTSKKKKDTVGVAP